MAALLCGLTGLWAVGTQRAATAQVAPTLTGGTVAVTVSDVSPTTPGATTHKTPLTFTLTLTNQSGERLAGLQVSAERGTPIQTQPALDAAITDPALPDPDYAAAVPAQRPVVVTLPANGTRRVVYQTTSSLVNDHSGLCICHPGAIYPIFFTVSYPEAGGAPETVGTAQTYLPAFDAKPQHVQVGWLWPIIDRPHRADLRDPELFTDDSLARSVSSGRLSRVLDVAEMLDGRVPLTLVVDPELIDELAVMSTGHYRVQSGAKTVPGTGAAHAKQWLQGLRSVLGQKNVELVFTAPADPDTESLTRAGLHWQTSLGSAARARVKTALGGHLGQTDVAWPVDETLDATTAGALAETGTTTVVVNDTTLPAADQTVDSDALAPLPTPTGSLLAAVAAATVQRYVAPALGAGGTASLPELVAELAMRTIEPGAADPFVVITPPRLVDPSPTTAVRAILETTRTPWSSGVQLGTAIDTVAPAVRGPLGHGGTSGLPPENITAIRSVSSNADVLRSMLPAADATPLLATVPELIQRLGSSAWVHEPAAGRAFAATVTAQLAAIVAGVHIQQPSAGSYTLASRSSPLPLTIDNALPYPVQVAVTMSTVDGLPGFTARTAGLHEIPAASRLTLQVSTHVERTGRFQVAASLVAPNSMTVGRPVVLSVHSTALGTIGVIITIVAAAVLALALIVRFWRRVLRRHVGAGRHSSGPAGS